MPSNDKVAATTPIRVPTDFTPAPSATATQVPVTSYSTLASPLNYALAVFVFMVVPAVLFVWLGGVRWLKRALGAGQKRSRSPGGSRGGSRDIGKGEYTVVQSEDLEK